VINQQNFSPDVVIPTMARHNPANFFLAGVNASMAANVVSVTRLLHRRLSQLFKSSGKMGELKSQKTPLKVVHSALLIHS
jgi:hypothetical protein